jgi:excisionase family DNA binding protein
MHKLLNVAEAAEFLGTTCKTLYSKASRREIPTVKIGRSLRFRLGDLERIIKAGLRPALRPPPGSTTIAAPSADDSAKVES